MAVSILSWRLIVTNDDQNDKRVTIKEVMEKFGIKRLEAAEIMREYSQEYNVEKTAVVSETSGNSKSPIFSLMGVKWKSDEELLGSAKLVIFTGIPFEYEAAMKTFDSSVETSSAFNGSVMKAVVGLIGTVPTILILLRRTGNRMAFAAAENAQLKPEMPSFFGNLELVVPPLQLISEGGMSPFLVRRQILRAYWIWMKIASFPCGPRIIATTCCYGRLNREVSPLIRQSEFIDSHFTPNHGSFSLPRFPTF
ncbi:uncharacterized protein LOC131883431 [Tigriopus californicus]|uniref:uncharacterized protein LOC131883431 n=1 Tax=Tigriopus californicus TaxID=6832 RepID=UPI0027DA26C0|nr:uncharacterized protein LOC131883431 [Tigriopus californicus]